MTTTASSPLLIGTDRGLYCPAGDFYVDAWRPVDRTIITHAHSDHARRGAARYLAASDGARVLKQRLGQDINLTSLDYGQSVELNGVKISLHPAGHVLGSAQVRIEQRGEVWVVSGDYKRHADPTCRGFEPVRCHTFITECTFGLPIFRWSDPSIVTQEINDWWRENRDMGRTSVVLAYSLGKAQRVLAHLDPSIGPILLHGAVTGMVQAYRDSGVALPPAEYASVEAAKRTKGQGAMVIAPPAALESPWIRKFEPVSAGVASGWMQVRGMRRRRRADRGFVLSDHVDWPGLLATIDETGAHRVIATHGYQTTLVRFLKERGMDSYEISTRFKGEGDELETEEAAVDEASLAAV
jgi:putative mRNA 3-end processing factor